VCSESLCNAVDFGAAGWLALCAHLLCLLSMLQSCWLLLLLLLLLSHAAQASSHVLLAQHVPLQKEGRPMGGRPDTSRPSSG